MQTNFGCCLKDGKIVNKKKKPESGSLDKRKKRKKIINQQKVEFE